MQGTRTSLDSLGAFGLLERDSDGSGLLARLRSRRCVKACCSSVGGPPLSGELAVPLELRDWNDPLELGSRGSAASHRELPRAELPSSSAGAPLHSSCPPPPLACPRCTTGDAQAKGGGWCDAKG